LKEPEVCENELATKSPLIVPKLDSLITKLLAPWKKVVAIEGRSKRGRL
jgi:hypothetical protein